MEGRSQHVSVQGSVSEKFDLKWEVPQGSCLGPLLFILYASELFNIFEAHLPSVHCYVDDIQLYLSFRPNDNHGEDDALKAMELCVQDIRAWLSRDKLFMNDKKTEFLVIGTRQQLKKVSIDCLTIGAEKILVAEKLVKNLGMWLDSKLSMDANITKTCAAAFYFLDNIRRIRRYLSKESTESLIHAFISSRLDYCNSLFYNIPAYQLEKLQRIQNAAARLILKESKFCHITPLLMTLHWLPVKYRIHFKILLLTFKAINFLAPSYICDLVTLKKPSNYNLRSNSSLVLDPPKVKTLPTLGDRSFSFAAPKLWNKLPNYIRTSATITIFKPQLKTYLFRVAFDLN
ncbi:uncharacterized protein [Montipora foliosa]|uniref:uncharacterized protein n=1 Tax=Montipora foliosa TaxID=591990 RepID=UPI0035F1BDD5